MVINLFLWELLPADWIAIVNLVATGILGVWIGISVQFNLSTNRALKEYYIEEIKILNNDYSIFMAELYAGKSNSPKIPEWFKVMHIKIETLQSSIVSELNILPSILTVHVQIKHYLTNTQEFNTQYANVNLQLSVQSKNDLLDFHKQFKTSIVDLIVKVNSAKK